MSPEQRAALTALDLLVDACQAQQEAERDLAVEALLQATEELRSAAGKTWPPTEQDRNKAAAMGVVSVRNLEDWLPHLASAFTALSYSMGYQQTTMQGAVKTIQERLHAHRR